LRFGIGSDFQQGRQVDFVLDSFTEEEQKLLPERIDKAIEIIKSFALSGVDITMNLFNNK